ncbi:MAG TPA: hypothetical protein VGB77_22640 [Abditibacteriaceae bacterium]|jgi:hypothetical protein
MKHKYWVVIVVLVSLPLICWLNWIRGHEFARSRRAPFTLVIRQAPQKRFWFNLLTYWIDSGEHRSTTAFSFAVYSDYQAYPITSFSTPDSAFDNWKTVQVTWITASRFSVACNDSERVTCEIHEEQRGVTWRRKH